MSRPHVLMTGGAGLFGTILQPRLAADMDVDVLDARGADGSFRSDHDLTDPAVLDRHLPGHGAVVHLAWDNREHGLYGGFLPEVNLKMAYHVFDKALEHGVRRVIIASSVHADRRPADAAQPLRTDLGEPVPGSPYGASKLAIEALGRMYASRGLEVVAIRFGRMTRDDRPPADEPGIDGSDERRLWLRHDDGAELVRRAVLQPSVPAYTCVYAVSDNQGRYLSLRNPLGWYPQPNGWHYDAQRGEIVAPDLHRDWRIRAPVPGTPEFFDWDDAGRPSTFPASLPVASAGVRGKEAARWRR